MIAIMARGLHTRETASVAETKESPMTKLRTAAPSILLAALCCAPLTLAQQDHANCPMLNAAGAGTPERSPYAGQETRGIKALSEDQRQQLLDGHGMGLALAAELNHYPGPKHVLELASRLELTDDQIGKTQAIFHEMHVRAQALGKEIIDAEAALDRRFSGGTIDEASLADAVRAIGRLQSDLRIAHLRAHLQMKAELTAEQARRYDELRGYLSAAALP